MEMAVGRANIDATANAETCREPTEQQQQASRQQ